MNGYQGKFCPVCGRQLTQESVFCPGCGTRQPAIEQRPNVQEFSPMQGTFTQGSYPVQENNEQVLHPMRAVLAAAGFIAALIVIFLLHCIRRYPMAYSNEVTVFLNTALFGTGLYLLMVKGKKWKLFAVGILLVYIFLSSLSSSVSALNQMTYGRFSISKLFNIYFKRNYAGTTFPAAILMVAVISGAPLLFRLIFRRQKPAKQIWFTSVLTSVYFLTYQSIVFFGSGYRRLPTLSLISSYMLIILETVILLLIPSALHSLCAMKERSFRPRGWGLVWSILGIAGMCAALLICVINILGKNQLMYSFQVLSALTAMIGFILLVSGRKAGWFLVLFSGFTVIHADVYQIILRMIMTARLHTTTEMVFISILFWCLNPLFTWLSIRKAWLGKNDDYR